VREKSSSVRWALLWVVETLAALNRKKNSGDISEDDFNVAADQLVAETDLFFQPKADSADVRQSMAFVLAHNINASDALHLHLALKLHRLLSVVNSQIVLVAADQRLLRAAEAEGLVALNPETATPTNLQALL